MDNFSDKTIEILLDRIYCASADPRGWQSVVDQLASLCEGGAVSLQGHDFATNRHLGIFTSGLSPEAVASFRDHFAGVNPWAKGMARWPVGQTLIADRIVTRDDLVQTEFYNDFLKPQGDISLGVGAIADRTQLRFFALSVNLRAKDENNLHQKMVKLFDTLSPHLQRAFRVSRTLGEANVASGGIKALELVPTPSYLLSAAGRLLYANRAARHPNGPAADYFERAPRMTFFDGNANIRLAAALKSVSDRGEAFVGAETFDVRTGNDRARATVIPFLAPSGFHGMFASLGSADPPVAILFLETARMLRADRKARLVRYGLTEAEAEIVLGLCDGQNVEQLATLRARSMQTVRNQVQSAFLKLEVRRQSELVAKVLQLR